MVKIYFGRLKQQIKIQLEYKLSSILSIISQFGVFFSYYFIIIALFQKFNNIKGFTVYEILLCFSIIHIGFSINEVFFRGLDKFEDFIIDGSLDRLLVRPQGILFQVISTKMDLIKIMRTIQAFIIMGISLNNIDIEWSLFKVLVLIMMIIASVLIFFGLFTLMASYCFITVQGLEVKNLVTNGGKHLAQYPIGIFKKGFIFFFTFIIPYAVVNYYPLLYFIGKSNNIIYALSPILIGIFLIPCLLSFKWGLKKYTSAGS